ncbi:MAG: calcium-binding protein, partial [Caldilineaceae bacterium]|nr:calcium-binding protein [Caldilineaceae bacterium]
MVFSISQLLEEEGIGFARSWYLAENPDVAEAVSRGEMTALEHFQRHGWLEGRDPHPLFDTSWYLSRYGDVNAAHVEPLEHYQSYGIGEGRIPTPFFDAEYYLGTYTDVAEAVDRGETNAYRHFLTHGYEEGRNGLGLLDESYYLAQNPDVAEAGFSSYQHYSLFGQYENRAPNVSFQPLDYAAQLASQGITLAPHQTLVQHYLTVGQGTTNPAGTTGEVADDPQPIGNRYLIGTANTDPLTGDIGNDTITGLNGADTLAGGDGNDLIYGGMDDLSVTNYNLTGLSTASNLKLWLDGNDLDGDGTAEGLSEAGLTGSAVGTWADKSGAGYNITNIETAPSYATNQLNNRSNVLFDSAGTRMKSTSLPLTSQPDATILLAGKATSGAFYALGDGSSINILHTNAPDKIGLNSGVGNLWGASGVTFDDYHLYSSYAVSGNGNQFRIWVDGIEPTPYHQAGAAPSNAFKDGFVLGGWTWDGSASVKLGGNISEVILFDTALSTADRQSLEYYLAEKWNLNVAGDNDILSGGAGSDTLYGGTGDDTLDGGADADTLLGGAGADSLTGGLGADSFRFTSTTDAGTGAAKDTISDFSQGQGDKIDLSAMNLGTIYLMGTTGFTSTGAAELRWSVAGGDTTLQLDTDGDGTANLEILLQSFDATAPPMTTADFVGTVVNHATFTDITGAAGVGDTGNGIGITWSDYDNDGD